MAALGTNLEDVFEDFKTLANIYILNFSVLLIPFVIYIISCLLNFHVWNIMDAKDIETAFPYNSGLYKNFYFALYIVGLLLFIYGFWCLRTELRSYKTQQNVL